MNAYLRVRELTVTLSGDRIVDGVHLDVDALTGGRFGIVLVGDSLLRERTWRALIDEAGLHTAPSVGPGTDLSALYARTDPWTGARRPGILDRARTEALLLPAAELLSPSQTAALAHAPRMLAQAPTWADVPTALAPRLTAVLDLAHRPGDSETLRSAVGRAAVPGPHRHGAPAGPTQEPDAHELVDQLTRYGLIDHTLDLGAARLARALALTGCTGVLETVEHLVCRSRSQLAPPPAESPGPADENTEPAPDTAAGGGTGSESDPESAAGTEALEGPQREPSHDAGPPGPEDPPGSGDEQDSDQAPEQAPEPPGTVPSSPKDPRRVARRPTRTRLDGKHGAPSDHAVRGRRRRVVRVEAAGTTPDLVATLTAALPWQHQRRAPGEDRLVVRPEDLRGRIRRLRGGRLLVIVVDASGSMAQNMIRRAKAIAFGELDRAYRERSTVCIVLARGPRAVIGLPPTRSTSRARDALRALPTGGGTPLASAFLLAAKTASRYDAAQVDAIVLTDGRANVGLGADPRTDAIRTAGLLSAACRTMELDPIAPRGRTDTTGWLRRALTVGQAATARHQGR